MGPFLPIHQMMRIALERDPLHASCMFVAQFPRISIRAFHQFSTTYEFTLAAVGHLKINSGIVVPQWHCATSFPHFLRIFPLPQASNHLALYLPLICRIMRP